jgi:PAS domain S-box-containing protein
VHPYVLIPLFAGVVATALAGAVLARSASQRADRLLAAILGCGAYWSFLEVIWNTTDQAATAVWLIRASSLGWMPLGPLCVHLFIEISGQPSARLRRAVPAMYAMLAACLALYLGTPWCVSGAVRLDWGWGIRFGPLFYFAMMPTAGCAVAALMVLWRRVFPADGPRSERHQGYAAFAAIGIPFAVGVSTDAVLPSFGIHVPRLGSASLVLVVASLAWSAHRYGYSLASPGALANEVLATLREGVALLRYDGAIRVANGGLARLVGCELAELTGRRVTELMPQLADLPPEELQEFECPLITNTGDSVAVSVSSSLIRDRRGNRVGWVAVVRDLREVATLRRNLVISGRLAAVGELAAGIAHEINNPIAFVQSNLMQLREHWRTVQKIHAGEGDRAQLEEILGETEELVDESLDGVQRVAAIVRDVRGFSHAAHGEREFSDLNALLENTLRMAAPQIRERAMLQREFGDLPLVACNPQQLTQVFLNLIVNAAHAIGDSGIIRVATSVEGDHAVVEVEDDGCGIASDVIDRVFDPFFTTKSVGEGTGLGLAISYQIIHNHGGDIEVHSELGGGSRFRLRIPVDPRRDDDTLH